MTAKKRSPTIGSRGGRTTVYQFGKGKNLVTMLRKGTYFSEKEWEAIEKESLETGESKTSVIRRAVREHLALPEE